MAEIIEEGTFDLDEYADELRAAPTNLDVGTKLRYENEYVRVWEVDLQPGERGPFHAHTRRYFWSVVDGGIGRQRYADGTYKVRRYYDGDTSFSEHSPEDPHFHDFENYGDTHMRFITVELMG